MKKNITMNLFGTLYAIDEDAYQLFEHYLESMSNYFSRQDEGEEIADDIEHRVAELLWIQKTNGNEVINIEMITDIIKTIGNPADIDENPSDNDVKEAINNNEEVADETILNQKESIKTRIINQFKYRHLYRIHEDKLIGGVCSGFSKYFNFSDSTFWRILFVVIFAILCYIDKIINYNFCFATIFAVAYIVLWIIVPWAKTTEDVLRMKGREVNPNNIKEEIIKESKKKTQQYYFDNTTKKNRGGCLRGIQTLFFTLFLIVLIVLLGVIIFVSVISLPIFTSEPINGIHDLLNSYYIYNVFKINNSISLSIFLISAFISVIISIYVILHKLSRRRKPFNTGLRIALIITWILPTVIALTILIGNTSINIKRLKKIDRKKYEIECKKWENDENIEKKFIDDNGWFIITQDNCADNRCTSYGEYLDGNTETRYLDAYNSRAEMKYTASYMVRNVQPGLYRLCAHARAEDKGAFIYITIGDTISSTNRRFTEIPSYSNEGGELWHWAKGHISDKQAHIYDEISNELRNNIIKAHNGKGYGWSNVVIDSINIKEPTTIYYGVSTDNQFTGINAECQWFSATDFVFNKIGKK